MISSNYSKPQFMDYLFRLVSSFYFRIIVIFYGFVLTMIQDNIYPIYIYSIVSVVYFILYLYTLVKRKHLLRTLIDFLFISIILYGKDFYLVYNFVYALFPLINSTNHSSAKRSLKFISLINFIFIMALVIINTTIDYKQNAFLFIIVIFCSLLLTPEYLRSVYNEKINTLFELIDKIMPEDRFIEKILMAIIDKLNEIFKDIIFMKNVEIKMINIFLVNDDYNTYVKNSNIFISQYNIEEILKKIKEKDYSRSFDDSVIINDKEYKNTYNILINNYLFNIILGSNDKNKSFTIPYLILNDYIKPIIVKISRILIHEDNLYKMEISTNKRIHDKYKFVSTVTKSTHFMSNKFSSIKNILNIVNEMRNKEKNNSKELEILLEDELQRAKNSFNEIEKYSLRVLDKSDNPFIPKDLSSFDIRIIIVLIKKLWLINNLEENIKYIGNFNNLKINLINLNLETLNVIIVNILENIRKYGIKNDNLIFKIENGINLNVIFENKIKNFEDNKNKLITMASNYNTNDRNEINKRESHGIHEIKELTSLLDIESKLEVNLENCTFSVGLNIKGELNV
ncbi:hypothetical protein ACOL29_07015 [Aliarcobacter butzleri]